jgi:O-antigen/teichoic acid export membrane protein
LSQGRGTIAAQEALDTAVSREGGSADDFTSKVARNSAFVMASQILMKALGFLFNVYVVRRLGDEHFGQYAAVMAFIAIFAIFSDLGMAPYMLREIAGDRKNVYWLLPNVVVLRLLLSAGVVVVSTLVAYWVGKDPAMVLGIFIAACGLFLYAIQGPLDSILTAWERLDYSASLTLVSQFVFWGLGTLGLVLGWGFIGLLVASLVSVASLALLEGRIVFREIGFRRLRVAPRRWPELVKAGLPFGISGLSFSLQGRFDSVLMSITLTDAAVGWYNVPLQLTQMSMLLAQSVCTSMFPSLTRAYSEDQRSIYGIVQRSLKYLLMLSLPIAVGATVIADRLVVTLYTEEFVRSIPLMRILIWTLPALFLSELMGALIMATRQEKAGAKVNVVNALISVGLNLVAVPTAGVLGAAWARVGSRGIRLGQYWKLLGSELLVGARWKELVRVVLAAGTMGVGLLLLGNVNLFLSIGAGAVLYVVSLFVFRAVSREELGHLARLLLKRRTRWATTQDAGTGVEI